MSESEEEITSWQRGDQERQLEGDRDEQRKGDQEEEQQEARGAVVHQGIILTSRSDLFKILKFLSEWTCYQIKKKSRWWNETQSEGAFACSWDCTLRAFSWNLCVSSI